MASSKPSSSSSVPARGRTHDVFLSFRGEDTRNNFVDHLYAALDLKGIQTFKDDVALRRGKPISPELVKGIEESWVAVVVFSKNYAHSRWCLEELAKIMECQDLKVLPVFYHVDPSDVRGQKRDFATAFEQHDDKFREEMDKVNKWRKALTEAANLSGHHISDVSGGENATINKIVQDILVYITPQSIENDLIDIESRIDALNSLLDIEATEEVRIIGIHGMGGIGKTTIARTLFTRIASKFAGCSFVNDVRENSSSNKDTCALQEKILKDILAAKDPFGIQDPKNGANMIQKRLCNKKVLLVLDDVADVKQLVSLAATREWFGTGSRIIITTRDEHLLPSAIPKYKPPLLNEDQAFELFSKHAFPKGSPPKEYEELSYRVIRYTGRLPLALKVLGSFLSKRKVGAWESALDRLAKTPNREILDTLKLSFDGLEDSEKKIFLDIACFFKGRNVDDVTRMLHSFGFHPKIGIDVLIEKSLITVSYKMLDMHDLIQEMGRQIVRESVPNSRIWKLEELRDLTKKNRLQELEAIEAIVLPWQELNGDLSADVFESTKNLRLLEVQGGITCSEPTFLPDKLRWLRWSGCPFSSLPVADMPELVGLEIIFSKKIEHLRKGKKIMPNLKFKRLVYLNMSYCKNLKCLPSRFEMESLKTLDLSLCESLERLPELSGMESLKTLNLSHCGSLEKLPEFSGVPNIERLQLSFCRKLEEVDESLGFLKRLVYLDMNYCTKLKRLPSRFEMESLETLILSHCDSLKGLPEFSGTPNIERLDLSFCENLEEVDESLGFLKRLVYLDMNCCKTLKRLPSRFETESLKTLILSSCESLERLPVFSGAPNIERLTLSFCKNLVEVDESLGLGVLKRLVYLEITNCRNLKGLPSRFEMESLETLILSCCDSLKKLPEFSPCMLKLSHISLSCCWSLLNISSICHLSNLTHLNLHNCYQLQNLPGLSSGIQVLEASGCKSLEKIEDVIKKYECLNWIHLQGCKKLLRDEENAKYLESMLRQSFLKIQKWAAVDGWLSVAIPGSKIPCWFEEQQHGGRIALKLPPNWKTRIMGFAICGLFRSAGDFEYPEIELDFQNDEMFVPTTEDINASAAAAAEEEEEDFEYPEIELNFENDEMFVPTTEDINASAAAAAEVEEEEAEEEEEEAEEEEEEEEEENWAVWINYVPFSSFKGEESHIFQGNLVVGVSTYFEKTIRCGVHVVYKEEVESTQQIKPPPISSYYWKYRMPPFSQNRISFLMGNPFRK